MQELRLRFSQRQETPHSPLAFRVSSRRHGFYKEWRPKVAMPVTLFALPRDFAEIGANRAPLFAQQVKHEALELERVRLQRFAMCRKFSTRGEDPVLNLAQLFVSSTFATFCLRSVFRANHVVNAVPGTRERPL